MIRRLGLTLVAGLVCALGAALVSVASFGAQDAAAPAPREVTLEFEIPSRVESQGAATFEPRAVLIAVVTSSSRTLQSVTVERSAWQVRGNKAQVSFQLAAVPPGSNPVALRLRFLSDGPPGEWSKALEGISAPETPFVGAPTRAPRPPRGVALRELDSRSALKKAVNGLLGPNQPIETALGAFNNVRDLALAVVISRTHQLGFVDLCAAIKGPPTLRLPDAVQKLNPKLDASAVMRNARTEARTLALQDGQAVTRPRRE